MSGNQYPISCVDRPLALGEIGGHKEHEVGGMARRYAAGKCVGSIEKERK